MADKFDILSTDGTPVKLSITSVIYEGELPESVMENVEFLADEDDEEYESDAPDGPQRLEQVTEARYSVENGRVTVTYDDSEILDMPETITQITFREDEPTCISIVRSGALRSMITVEEGIRNMGEYKLGPYSIPVSFYGRRVKNTFRDGKGVIELDYTVEMSGSGTSHTKMKLVFEDMPSSPIKL